MNWGVLGGFSSLRSGYNIITQVFYKFSSVQVLTCSKCVFPSVCVQSSFTLPTAHKKLATHQFQKELLLTGLPRGGDKQQSVLLCGKAHLTYGFLFQLLERSRNTKQNPCSAFWKLNLSSKVLGGRTDALGTLTASHTPPPHILWRKTRPSDSETKLGISLKLLEY